MTLQMDQRTDYITISRFFFEKRGDKNKTKGDNSKSKKAELSFLNGTRHLVLFYISTKYHKNISKVIRLTELTGNQCIITVKYNKGRFFC